MTSVTPEGTASVDAEFPATGERFRFTSPADDRSVFAFDFMVAPGGGVPVAHRHQSQDEVFRCRAGALTVTLDGDTTILRAGDEVTVPAGTLHSMVNEGEDEVLCDVEYRPAGRNREWFQIQSAFQARTGREPGFLDIAPFIGDVSIFIAQPPIPMQKGLYAVSNLIARLLGRRRRMLAYARDVYGPAFDW